MQVYAFRVFEFFPSCLSRLCRHAVVLGGVGIELDILGVEGRLTRPEGMREERAAGGQATAGESIEGEGPATDNGFNRP